MKRLKINGLEINRINDKSVGKWNKDDILLTNKNPLIPITIPTFEWNVSSSMLTEDEFNSLALIIPEKFLNYINVTYSDSTNVKIANITAKEGYVITKGQTEYRKVYNLYSIADHITFTDSTSGAKGRNVDIFDLVNMFPSMLGTDGYLTYNAEAVNYLKNIKESGKFTSVTASVRLTKWKDNALRGSGVTNFWVHLLDDNLWAVPNKGTGGAGYLIELINYNRILHMPYIGTNDIDIRYVGNTAQNNPTACIPTIFTTTIDSGIKTLTIKPPSTFTKDDYYKYYDNIKTRIRPGAGQKVILDFVGDDIVIE